MTSDQLTPAKKPNKFFVAGILLIIVSILIILYVPGWIASLGGIVFAAGVIVIGLGVNTMIKSNNKNR